MSSLHFDLKRRTSCILMYSWELLPVPSDHWLWFSPFPRQAAEFVPPASSAGPPPLYASELLEPVKGWMGKQRSVKKWNFWTTFLYFDTDNTKKRYQHQLIFTCKLSWTRSASLFAKAVSKMLECSRSVLWDCASPASFPFSCSSSSASFLLASSNFRIRFLKHRDSWSCEINSHHVRKFSNYRSVKTLLI